MKKIVCAALAAFALTTVSAEAQRANTPFANWTGCYVGGQVGFNWGNLENLTGAETLQPHGANIGGLGGCDFQIAPNFLIGIQGEWNVTNADDFVLSSSLLGPTSTLEVDTKSFGSVTARFGYVSGAWLLYAKGGAAWARSHLRDTFSFVIISSESSGRETFTGWTAGLGTEFLIAPNWSIFTELSYYDFGSQNVVFSGSGFPGGPFTAEQTIRQDFYVVKFGVTYRFGAF